MRNACLKVFLFSLTFFNSEVIFAQDNTSQKQIWPELDLYYRFNPKFRLFTTISGTRSNSEYTDGTTSVNLDYFALPWLRGRQMNLQDTTRGYFCWFRVGYSYSASPGSEENKKVNILQTEMTNNFRLPAEVLFTTRNRLDWRFVNGDFQPIYRPRVHFSRNFKTEYLTFNFYVWSEYFFYLNDNSLNRLRLTAGSEIKVLKNMDFEFYYLYQFRHTPAVEPLNAIGLQLNFYLRSKHYP